MDLYCEGFGAGESTLPEDSTSDTVCGFPVIYGSVSSGGARDGRYATLKCGSMAEAARNAGCTAALSELLNRFSEADIKTPYRRVLVLCLGNGRIAADSVGESAARHILSGKVGEGFSAVIKTGVPLSTGVHSADVARAMVKELQPNLVVCVDSLAAVREESVCSLIQITDCGICPGSGVSSHGEPISRQVLDVPVVTIGIPTVRRGSDGRIFTIATIEDEVSRGGAVIASAINSLITRL